MSYSFINEAWSEQQEPHVLAQAVPENADLLIKDPQKRVQQVQVPEPPVEVILDEPVIECKKKISALEDYVRHLKDVIQEMNTRISDTPSQSKPYHINDLVIYIATGAFLIFVLDAFSKISNK